MTDQRSIEVYFDEGALNGEFKHPSACGVVVDGRSSIEVQIENLRASLLMRPDIALEPGFALLEKQGFHHVDDNLSTKLEFIALLPRLSFDWYCSAVIDESNADPYIGLPKQFEWILDKIARKYDGYTIHCIFEQNSQLNSIFPSIVNTVAQSLVTKSPLITFSIETKQSNVLAVADYCIAIASQAINSWKECCCAPELLPKKHAYRTFKGIEGACSVLFAHDHKKSISSRSRRLMDRTYFQAFGRHSPTCLHKL